MKAPTQSIAGLVTLDVCVAITHLTCELKWAVA